jgi:hypothetical protein
MAVEVVMLWLLAAVAGDEVAANLKLQKKVEQTVQSPWSHSHLTFEFISMTKSKSSRQMLTIPIFLLNTPRCGYQQLPQDSHAASIRNQATQTGMANLRHLAHDTEFSRNREWHRAHTDTVQLARTR